jgi:NitT/TauT family transport system permease protein
MRATVFDPKNRVVVQATRLVLLLSVLFMWWLSTNQGWLSPFFFGEPIGVARRIIEWWISGTVFQHLYTTLVETLLAFVIGTCLGLACGLWLALNPFLAVVFDPFIKAMNSMPRLIFAPIFALWFGLGIWSKVALGVTLVFFVVFFNVFQGVREVSPAVLSNTRMLGANSRQLMRHVYMPSAMSWVFSSLHNAVGIAFVGSVVGEYLGSEKGVGYLILLAEGVFDINSVIAGILLLTLFALALDMAVSVFENYLMRWRPVAGQTVAATT